MATGKWDAQREEDLLRLLLTDSSAGSGDYVHHHGKRYGTASSAGDSEEMEELPRSTFLPLRYKEEGPVVRNQTFQMTINMLSPSGCDYGGWSYILLAIAAVFLFPPLGTAALVLAVLARQNAVRDRKSAERYSRTSLIISIVSIVSGLILIALVLGFTLSSHSDNNPLSAVIPRHRQRSSNSPCPASAPYLHDEVCYLYMLRVISPSHCVHGHYGNHHCYYEYRRSAAPGDKYDNAGRCDLATDGYCYTKSRGTCNTKHVDGVCFQYAFPIESGVCRYGHQCGSFCGYKTRHANDFWHRWFDWRHCDCLNYLYCYCY